MTGPDRKTDRGAAMSAPRLVGTVLLTLATAVVYAGGLWASWTFLFSHLPTPLGVLAAIGAALAPIQLVADIISADRADRRAADAQARGKDETLD